MMKTLIGYVTRYTKITDKLSVALILLLLSTTTSAFSLYQYQGQCGDTILTIGPVEDNKQAVTGIDEYGRGYIKMDPHFLQTHSSAAIDFVYYHECGHRVHGHTQYYMPHNGENVADCYAANRFIATHGLDKLRTVLWELLPLNGTHRNHQILSCR